MDNDDALMCNVMPGVITFAGYVYVMIVEISLHCSDDLSPWLLSCKGLDFVYDERFSCCQVALNTNYVAVILREGGLCDGMSHSKWVTQAPIKGIDIERHLLCFIGTSLVSGVHRLLCLYLIYARIDEVLYNNVIFKHTVARRNELDQCPACPSAYLYHLPCFSPLLVYGGDMSEDLCSIVIFKLTVARRIKLDRRLACYIVYSCYLPCTGGIDDGMLLCLKTCKIYYSNVITCVNVTCHDVMNNDCVCFLQIHYYDVKDTYTCPSITLSCYDV